MATQKNNKKSTSKNNVGKAVAIGAGVAAIAGAAYFFLGPNGKKHQKKLKSWMIRMKGDVVEKLEEAKELTRPVYESIIDAVATKYEQLGSIDPKEIKATVDELKRQWKAIVRAGTSKKRIVKKAVKKSVGSPKKAMKKVAKKGSRK